MLPYVSYGQKCTLALTVVHLADYLISKYCITSLDSSYAEYVCTCYVEGCKLSIVVIFYAQYDIHYSRQVLGVREVQELPCFPSHFKPTHEALICDLLCMTNRSQSGWY